MKPLIDAGVVFIAQPPLYRVDVGKQTFWAADDAQKEELVDRYTGKGKIEIQRFKGLGEMPPSQLKETTMNPSTRRLLQVNLPKRDLNGADKRRDADRLVTTLMGKKPELRFGYIREHSEDVLLQLDI